MFIYSIETILTVLLIAVIILFYLFAGLRNWFKYRNCEHKSVNETSACDAICKHCGKNLGFIGKWREKNKVHT